MTLVNTPLVVDNINACPVQTDYQYIVLFYAPNIEEQFFIQFWRAATEWTRGNERFH
jgi:hypothetical protein